jgi:predicted secreted Zn-dependent protease
VVAPAVASARRRSQASRSTQGRGDERELCTNDLWFRGHPAAIVGALRGSGSGVRERVIDQLQRQVGNLGVQRLVEDDRALPVQRWPVGVARGTTDCMVLVSWMNAHSPYERTSGWAKTNAMFDWAGPLKFKGDGDSLTVGVSNPAVTLSKSVDMPTWAPTHPAMRSAWSAMTADLRAHEAQHEAIADRWKLTLKERLTGLSLSISRRSQGQSAVQDEWNSWLAEHQADQTAIDPYVAMLDCSAAAEASSAEGGAGTTMPTSGAEEG